MRTFLTILVFAALSGCCPKSNHNISPDLSSGGAGGDGGYGSAGGAGGDESACPIPLLGYDPEDAPKCALTPTFADVGGTVAVVLEPFDVPTTCETVIVGFATGPAPCEMPSAIDVVVFDTATPEDPGVHPLTATVTLDGAPVVPTMTFGIMEARLHLQTSHAVGLHPFVGAIVRENFCPAVMPSCEEPETAMRYRSQEPWEGWSKLSDPFPGTPAGGVYGALYFGLADCVAD